MFHKKTVFVVGAGASAEAGLPIGSVLAAQISALLSIPADWALIGDEHKTFAKALQSHCEERNDLADYLELSHLMARGLQAADSIDEFVDTHRHDQRIAQIAKAAIAHTILQAERSSRFFKGQSSSTVSNPLPLLKETWYPSFGKLIASQIALDEIDRLFGNLTVVCFNYDRCVEEYLAHWLATRYAIDLPKSRQILSQLTVVRPYGEVAPLTTVAFGDTDRLSESFSFAQNIYTYSEQITDRGDMLRIKNAISEAETIAFLGFGFHRQNLEILRPDCAAKIRRIIATAKGLKAQNAVAIGDELKLLFENREGTGDLRIWVDINSSCATLFETFGRLLNPVA